jgi:uncharacterized membrane protein YsdA (DUF1294 family)
LHVTICFASPNKFYFLLHWIEFLGGWPGALFAQREIRHKNNKFSYQVIFWAIVVLHFGSWDYYLLTDLRDINLRHSFQWLLTYSNRLG